MIGRARPWPGANPEYLKDVRSVITGSGFNCPEIVHLWVIGESPSIGPKLEAFCDAKDPDALHYAYYPDAHQAVAWSNADDFEKRRATEYARVVEKTKRQQEELRRQQEKTKRELCQMADACDKYKQARLDCATANNLKSCVLIKMGDDSHYADLCSSGEIGAPALPRLPETPTAWECFLLEHPLIGGIFQ